MSRWYCEDVEYTQISLEDKLIRDKIVAMFERYSENMENYNYYGKNMGIPEGEFEDLADELMLTFLTKEVNEDDD